VILFGGLAPLTNSTLVHWTGNAYVPAFYLIFAGFVSLAMVFFSKAGRDPRPLPHGAAIAR